MNLRSIHKLFNKISTLTSRRYGDFKPVKRPDLKLTKIPTKDEMPKLIDTIREKIKLSGPITVADYMNTVATNPLEGYYVKKDVIGEHGDFITSPEICQLFGEILAVWFYSETEKMGLPRPLQLVELGPGRATLLADMLRVLGRLGYQESDLSLHLVEISPSLQQLQAARLCLHHGQPESEAPHYYEGESLGGSKVYWYDDLKKVPHGFSWFVAHEFFDALPIHIFEKTSEGWREILVDMDASDKLQFKLSAQETNAVKLLVRPPLDQRGPRLEVSARGLGLARQLARRVDQDGGLLLVADYGHSGEKGDTFRAFRKHALAHPLDSPGSCDLTADVDFSLLRLAAAPASADDSRAIPYGPVTQARFLNSCHAEARLQVLLDNAKEEDKESLRSAYTMLTHPDQMGDRFKFMAFYPSSMEEILQKYPPTGFEDDSK